MKKVLLFASCAVLLASCSNNELPDKPNNPGSDIKFSLKLDGSRQSRTLYGDEVNNAFPIYWVNDDRIIVASPQCAEGRNNAIYKVAVSGSTNSTAESVTKVGDTGVQWGENFPFNFYSVYPVSYNTTSTTEVKNSIENRTDNAVAHLNVRNYQINLFDLVNGEWKGTPIDRKSMTDLAANQKNPDALMYAQTRQTKNGNVELYYKPFTVAFHVTLDGYTLAGMGTDPTVTIEEVIITAPTGTQLVGNFDATFDANCVETPTVNTSVNTLREPNVIHIPTMSSIDGHYLTISQNQKVSFNVFAIPTDGTVTSDWTLTVRTTAGKYSRPLTPGSGANAGQLIAGQMHKLNMPKFQVTTDFQFNKESWIAQIPRNVYVSELSIPGAWYAGGKVNDGYQNTNNFGTMFAAGVRGFAVETRSATSSGFSDTPSRVVISGTGNNASVGGDYYYGGTRISTVMSNIIAQLQTHTDEYAVLVLSYADGGNKGHRAADHAYWLQGIYDEYNRLTVAEKSLVYSDEITPNTTVGDVAGKLIIKVNVASGLPQNKNGGTTITIGNYANNLPGLLSYTDLAWESSSVNSSLVSEMYWKSWSDSYMTNVNGSITSLTPTNLYWNYTVANRTKTDSSTAANLPSYANRQASISILLANSRAIREAGTHNVWFFVGAGGTEATSQSGGTTNATNFASTMNGWINQQLEAKINGSDFSPFGIVMCNQITNAAYQGPTIIDNIIKMNRLFRLERDESQPEWPGQQTQTDAPVNSVSQNHTSGYNVNPDGWSVF